MRALLAEMIGAGVVVADSDEAEWMGGGGHPAWDVRGDKTLVDVKYAWHHKDGVLGIPPPPKKKTGKYEYDPSTAHEISLVVLADVLTEHEYLPDGTVALTARARPSAVYRVPVATMNALMRRDGLSRGRWLVDLSGIADFLVRQA
jgi:hypothetical protein